MLRRNKGILKLVRLDPHVVKVIVAPHHPLGCGRMLLVKKYPNRRLYDTRSSRYITLDDLEKTIRLGEDVAVQDAQDGRDLTQETLTQIILDRGGGKILPASLLMRLIRLDDAALGEFLSRYVSWALEVYLQAQKRARALLPLNPLATAPFAATDALARLVLGATSWGKSSKPPAKVAPQQNVPPPEDDEPFPAPPAGAFASEQELDFAPDLPSSQTLHAPSTSSVPVLEIGEEMLRLRQEIEALKNSMRTGGIIARPRKKTGIVGRKPPPRSGQ